MPKYKAVFIEQRLDTWEYTCEVEAKDLKEAKRLLLEDPHEYITTELTTHEQVLPRTVSMQRIRKMED
jgi:hypothetical protein